MTTRITSENITDGTIATADLGAGVGGTSWQSIKTANYTAVAGQGIFADTSGGAWTLTLPASPSAGDEVTIVDYAGTFGSENLTIARNGSNFDSSAADHTLNSNGVNLKIVYTGNATVGWTAIFDEEPQDLGALYTQATGGTESTSGDYKIHTFNSSSNFVVSSVGNPVGGGALVSYLVIAGGGGGGRDRAGGGGAGGFREGKASGDPYSASPLNAPAGITASAQTYPITVGAGGAGGFTSPNTNGSNGSQSIFSTITSAGGGGGHTSNRTPYAGNPGGSGGGGGGSVSGTAGSGNTPPVSPSQGNPGGAGQDGGNSRGAGGGGAGGAAAGAPTSPSSATAGGAGASSEITGSAVTRAGGGGATGTPPTTTAAGGSGGGGDAGNPAGSAGTANTGGGGGASQQTTGGAGGSGVVIIRYKYQN